MARIRSKGMKPELRVRKATHAMGYRYRLHATKLPGKPDLIFPSRKKLIFVHGCFWHQHDDPQCPDGRRRKPKTNTDFWNPKLQGNVERDLRNQRLLKKMGWKILIVWECETTKPALLATRIKQFLK